MMTTKNFQLFFIGKTVAEMLASLNLDLSKYSSDSPIDKRRHGMQIAAIRRKKAFAANIHILGVDCEWITVNTETGAAYVCGLSARQEDRVWMFGADAAAKYPRPLNG